MSRLFGGTGNEPKFTCPTVGGGVCVTQGDQLFKLICFTTYSALLGWEDPVENLQENDCLVMRDRFSKEKIEVEPEITQGGDSTPSPTVS